MSLTGKTDVGECCKNGLMGLCPMLGGGVKRAVIWEESSLLKKAEQLLLSPAPILLGTHPTEVTTMSTAASLITAERTTLRNVQMTCAIKYSTLWNMVLQQNVKSNTDELENK